MPTFEITACSLSSPTTVAHPSHLHFWKKKWSPCDVTLLPSWYFFEGGDIHPLTDPKHRSQQEAETAKYAILLELSDSWTSAKWFWNVTFHILSFAFFSPDERIPTCLFWVGVVQFKISAKVPGFDNKPTCVQRLFDNWTKQEAFDLMTRCLLF